jgi:hypothetical protein
MTLADREFDEKMAELLLRVFSEALLEYHPTSGHKPLMWVRIHCPSLCTL